MKLFFGHWTSLLIASRWKQIIQAKYVSNMKKSNKAFTPNDLQTMTGDGRKLLSLVAAFSAWWYLLSFSLKYIHDDISFPELWTVDLTIMIYV